MLAYKSRALANRSHDGRASAMALISLALTIFSAVCAGLWVLFEFVYTRQIEPRLIPAIVEVNSEAKYISSIECCHLYEIETRVVNKGRRAIIVHASHQAVGARTLSFPSELSAENTHKFMADFLSSRTPHGRSDYMTSGVVDYVSMQANSPFLVISVGNLMKPGSGLAPGETHLNRSVAVFPMDYVVGSIRTTLMVSHFEQKNIDWRWTVNPTNLEPLPMPWFQPNNSRLNRLTECMTTDPSEAERKKCIGEIQSESSNLFKEVWSSDKHSYMQNLAVDFLVVPPAASKQSGQ